MATSIPRQHQRCAASSVAATNCAAPRSQNRPCDACTVRHLPRPSRSSLLAGALAAPPVLWALARTFELDAVGHPVVAAMTLTPYAAALAPIAVIAAVLLRAWPIAAVALAATGTLAWAVAPRALDGGHRASADAQGTAITVMTANVYGDRGDMRAVARLVRERRVDVLSLQELTAEGVGRLDAAGIRTLLPGRVLDPRPRASGTGLMARWALRPVGRPPPLTGAAEPEAALRLPDGERLRVRAVHPIPPTTAERVREWRRHLRELPGPSARDVPRLLLGDFNATLDHRELRRVLDRGYHDAADATGDGLRPSWPVGRRLPPITLDHVLVPDAYLVRRVSLHEIPGSDHRAVIAELVGPG